MIFDDSNHRWSILHRRHLSIVRLLQDLRYFYIDYFALRQSRMSLCWHDNHLLVTERLAAEARIDGTTRIVVPRCCLRLKVGISVVFEELSHSLILDLHSLILRRNYFALTCESGRVTRQIMDTCFACCRNHLARQLMLAVTNHVN